MEIDTPRNAMCAHKPQYVSNWLKPLSLGTMSAFRYIENLAKKINLFN